MAVAEVKGLPRYVKVIDASAQDADPKLDFTHNPVNNERGVRIQEHHLRQAVPAEKYASAAQEKIAAEKKAATDEAARLRAENEALAKRVAELEAAKQPAAVESAPVAPEAITPPAPPASDPPPFADNPTAPAAPPAIMPSFIKKSDSKSNK